MSCKAPGVRIPLPPLHRDAKTPAPRKGRDAVRRTSGLQRAGNLFAGIRFPILHDMLGEGAMQQRIRAGLTASSVTCPLPARNIFRIIWRSRGWKTRNTTLRSACNMPEESPGSRKTRSVARRSPIPCPTARKADAFPAGCRDDARLQSAAQPRTMFRARPETPRKRMKNAVRGFSNALPAAARERSRRG